MWHNDSLPENPLRRAPGHSRRVCLPPIGRRERDSVQDLPNELVSAARTALQDLRRFHIELGGAYERALVSAAEGGSPPTAAVLVAAIESGRQAVALYGPHRGGIRIDQAARVEITTLRRFTAAGREFEPNQRYRLTAVEFAEVERRAALEPQLSLYDRQAGSRPPRG